METQQLRTFFEVVRQGSLGLCCVRVVVDFLREELQALIGHSGKPNQFDVGLDAAHPQPSAVGNQELRRPT